ncbi:hypothetical protein DL96DRAFT_1703589 [Flagelloscypha sp. PMI_526]|nr:hypothetical protein DL96DRAFT_1703589 [Flagelloscypha sp. PMI_526]
MSRPVLPFDILEIVVDAAYPNKRTLKSLALVCLTLQKRATRHIFATIRFPHQNGLVGTTPLTRCETFLQLSSKNPLILPSVRRLEIMAFPARCEPLFLRIFQLVLYVNELQLGGTDAGCVDFDTISDALATAIYTIIPRLKSLTLHSTRGFPAWPTISSSHLESLLLIGSILSLPGPSISPNDKLSSLRTLVIYDSNRSWGGGKGGEELSKFVDLSGLRNFTLRRAHPHDEIYEYLRHFAKTLSFLRLCGREYALFSHGVVHGPIASWPKRTECPALRQLQLSGPFKDTASYVPWITSVVSGLIAPELKSIVLRFEVSGGTLASKFTLTDKMRHGDVWHSLGRTFSDPGFQNVNLDVRFVNPRGSGKGSFGHLGTFIRSMAVWSSMEKEGRLKIQC